VSGKDLPLAGVRVIDLTTSYAGPTATMYLGDMGAEVIKIERPDGGDDARAWGPPFISGESAWFLAANRNKRSLCLDLSSPQGTEILYKLLASADVLVASFNPSKLERLGIAPERIRSEFPRLVYCVMSGFGLDGPDTDRPGYDLISQARGGLMSVTGAEGGEPQRVSTALSDIVAGIIAAFSVASALRRQIETGEGELIDVSLLDAVLALMSPRIAAFVAGEDEPQPSGATDSVLAIYQSFQTQSGRIVLAVGNDTMWGRLCDALDLADLAGDERMRDNAGRRANRAELVAALSARLSEAPADEWLARLREFDIPCAPVQFLSDVIADPQVVARDTVVQIDHPRHGPVPGVESPWRFGDGRPPHQPPPDLGTDSRSILAELGLDEAEIDDLVGVSDTVSAERSRGLDDQWQKGA
jgi:crotonobetainyl-CoA:carnitine CoA-transferase CaiB-like acyl-CoA transferase